jgi:hypothetical protein
MMKTITLAAAGMLVLWAPTTTLAATVTLMSGEVVEGTIQGRVVIRRTSKDGEPAFRIVEGKDITRIDTSGVHHESDSLLLSSLKGATADDVLQGLIWWDEGRSLKTGQVQFRSVGNAQVLGAKIPRANIKPAPEQLTGGYTIDRGRKRIDLVNAIVVQRPDGQTTTIQVSEITTFQQ